MGQGGDGEVEVGHLWGDISSPACMREREPVTLMRRALAASPLPLLLWDVNVGGKHYLQTSFHRASISIRHPRLESQAERTHERHGAVTSLLFSVTSFSFEELFSYFSKNSRHKTLKLASVNC